MTGCSPINRRWLPGAVLALAVGVPGLAHGQPAGEIQTPTLEDLLKITVTTASRQAEGAGDAPAQIEVITARQIRARGYHSLGDLLRDQLGIKVEAGTDPDYPSDVTIQGTRNTSRLVVLLDGVKISSPTNEPLPIMANYPIHMARQVEIVFGPASALYGADAFSGVVNIITQDADKGGMALTTSAGQFGFANHTASFTQRIGTSGSLMLAGQWFQDAQADLSSYYPSLFGDLRAQRDNLFNTIFGPMQATGVVTPAFENPLSAHSTHATLTLGAFRFMLFESRERASTAGPNTPENAVYNADAFQQNDLLVGNGSYTRRFGSVASTSSLTWSRHELNPESGYWNVYSNLRRSYKYAFGSMLKAEQQVTWSPWRRVRLTGGGTFERYFAIPQGADLNAPITSRRTPGTILDTTLVDEFIKLRYSNTGGFLQAQIAASPRVSIVAGTRADYNSRYGGTVNPRLGTVLKPAPGTTVKLLYGTAFLAPSPYQSWSHYGSFYTTDGGATYASDYWHVGNPDLKPQRKSTVEASITQLIGPLVSVSAGAFRSRMDHVIKRDDPGLAGPGEYHGWPVAYIDFPVNEGLGTIHGSTVDGTFLKSWSPRVRLQARAGVSLVDGHVIDDDNPGPLPLASIAPVQARAAVDVELRHWTASTSLMSFGRQRVVAMADDGARQTLPGYRVVHLNLRRNQIARNLDAFLRVENLFDARYVHINERAISHVDELVGAPQSPRRISAGVTIRIGQ